MSENIIQILNLEIINFEFLSIRFISSGQLERSRAMYLNSIGESEILVQNLFDIQGNVDRNR